MKFVPSPAAPLLGMLGSDEYFNNAAATGLIRSAGIWLFVNATPVTGSFSGASPRKSPLFRAAVGMAEMTVVDAIRRNPSKLPKKNSLFFRIGPPTAPPYSLRLNGGFGNPVAKKFLAE